MECYGNVFADECVNLGSMFSCDQDSDYFKCHGLMFSSEDGDHGLNLETDPIFWPSANDSNSSSSDHNLSYSSSDHDLKSKSCYNYFSQESSSATDSPPQPCHDIFQFCPSKTYIDSVSDQSNELGVVEGDSSSFLLLSQIFSDDAMEEILCLKQDEVVLVKGKIENSVRQPMPIADRDKETPLKRMLQLPNPSEEANENPKKKTRVSRDNKKKKNMPPKKNQKIMAVTNSNEDDGEESYHHDNENITGYYNGKGNIQTSSSCSSEGDSNALRDLDGEAVNITVKTRAGRGSATDPQSIYARKRRERINERLKILQTLVPNGTKVDISTMLEEAVHYVKFLQLQIELLSSDDTWMYAPIAYNGMDMGLYQNISQNL